MRVPHIWQYGVTEELAKEKLLSVGFAPDDSTMAPASLTKQVRAPKRQLEASVPSLFSPSLTAVTLTHTLVPHYGRWAASRAAGA